MAAKRIGKAAISTVDAVVDRYVLVTRRKRPRYKAEGQPSTSVYEPPTEPDYAFHDRTVTDCPLHLT